MLDPYFSATKIEWLLRNVDGLAERARDGRAVFGTVDSWMLFKLTGEHVTEPSNAVAHAAAGHRRRALGPGAAASSSADPGALAARGAAELRRARRARAPTTSTASRCRSPAWPATSRRRCSGSAAWSPASARTPTAPARSCSPTRAPSVPEAEEGLLATIAWQIGRSTTYALEAAIFVTGAAVQWLRDGLGIISAGGRDRGAGGVAGLQRRRLLRPRADRARLAALGPVRARDDRRAHARQRPRAPRARRAGGDGLPDRRRRAGDGPHRPRAAGRAARRRRRDGQPLADAVPGRRARRPGRRAPRSRRRRRSARRCWRRRRGPADARPRWRELGDERARYEPRHVATTSARRLLDGWHRALERSRGWARKLESDSHGGAAGDAEGPRADEGAGLQGPAPGRVLRALPRALALARPRLGLRGRAGRHDAVRLDLLPHARDRAPRRCAATAR